MKPWEIWDSPLFGGHPRVIVSNTRRVDLKSKVVVLKCVTLRPGQPFRLHELNTTLDREDGLDTTTVCECDLFYTVEKAALSNRRGLVVWESQQDIARKMIQGLCVAGR